MFEKLRNAPAFLLVFALAACDGEPVSESPEAKATVRQPGAEVVLDNGIRYAEVTRGVGPAPGPEDYVTLHYRAFRADGTPLADSRRGGEAPTFRVSETLPGWREALSRMREGATWRVTLPPEFAYGEEGLGDMIGPNEELVFELALLRVETEEQWRARRLAAFKAAKAFRKANADYLEQNAARPGVTVTDSGLQYEVLQEGGGRRPTAEDVVRVHYRGTLIDGTEFDSSYARGTPAEFAVSRVIQGWQEALQLMNVGAKYRLVIPAQLAYGERGAGEDIKPGATLIFEVELLDVLDDAAAS